MSGSFLHNPLGLLMCTGYLIGSLKSRHIGIIPDMTAFCVTGTQLIFMYRSDEKTKLQKLLNVRVHFLAGYSWRESLYYISFSVN